LEKVQMKPQGWSEDWNSEEKLRELGLFGLEKRRLWRVLYIVYTKKKIDHLLNIVFSAL